MRKYWLIGLLLALVGCEKANEIFGYGESVGNGAYSSIVVGENYYDGPVYIDATSWGSVAYINEEYINKGIKLLISQADNAEGGMEIDVTSNAIIIDGMSIGTQFYYCLYMPQKNIKSEIMTVVVPDESVSALNMEIGQADDKVMCTVLDSINSVYIEEKGFKILPDIKIVIEGKDFAFSIADAIQKYGLKEGFAVYAYVHTADAYHRSYDLHVDLSEISLDSVKVNREEISISAISEETIEDVDYLKCTVTGYVDSVYFFKEWMDEPYNRIYPDKVITNDDGNVTTFYAKKGFYKEVRLKAYYKFDWGGSWYSDQTNESDLYTPTQFNIRTMDEFLEFVSWTDRSWDVDNFYISLLTDITIPSDMRLSIDLSRLILDGNGHTLDGISYFPLFSEWHNSLISVKNLKIGTDETVYNVKKGTSSLSTTDNGVPHFFLSNGDVGNYVTFENCEIRGTFKVAGDSYFYMSYDYLEEGQTAVTGDGYIEWIPGLKDYTKTEYVTITND